MAQYALGKIAISIHAPTRGATLVELEKTMNEIISIHAPTRGATIERLVYHLNHINFNPRSYKRSDITTKSKSLLLKVFQSTLLQEERHARKIVFRAILQISIHAPTRGATSKQQCCLQLLPISIHAPTRGATAKMHNIPYASLQ